MPRLKGPEKAQIRLRVRKELADYATEQGAAWLEGLLRNAQADDLPAAALPAGAGRAKPDLPEKNSPKPAASPVSVGPARPAPGSRLKKRRG